MSSDGNSNCWSSSESGSMAIIRDVLIIVAALDYLRSNDIQPVLSNCPLFIDPDDPHPHPQVPVYSSAASIISVRRISTFEPLRPVLRGARKSSGPHRPIAAQMISLLRGTAGRTIGA